MEPLTYRVLADLVLVVHFVFVLFVILGACLAVRWRWIPWVHIPAALWGAFVEFSGRICPLTPLENNLRQKAGLESYGGDFVEQYLLPILYPADLTRELQIVLGLIVIVINVLVYTFVIRRTIRAA